MDTPVGYTTDQIPQRRRRWLQFSLRSIMLLMLLLGCVIGPVTNLRWQSQRMSAILASIEERGGKIEFDLSAVKREPAGHNCFCGVPGRQPPKPPPTWYDRLGVKYHHPIKHIELNGLQFSESDLLTLQTLPIFPELTIRGYATTVEALGQLRHFTKLKSLQIHDMPITEADLVIFGDLQQLEELVIADLSMTDNGMLTLGKLKHLRHLSLHGTQITDDALKHVSELTDLEWLWLGETSITDRGLSYLQNLQRLELIELSDTLVTDQAIATLAQLPELKHAYFYGTEVTEAGRYKLERALLDCKTHLFRGIQDYQKKPPFHAWKSSRGERDQYWMSALLTK